jgi:DNA polymerase-1
MTHPTPRLFVIDGSGFIFRAFFALRPRDDPAGLASNAIYGFTNMLLRFVQQYRPEYLAFVLDAGGDSFRKRMSADYKATRPEIPADLIAQLASIREVLKALQVPLLELRGYEADDVLPRSANLYQPSKTANVLSSPTIKTSCSSSPIE